MRGPINMVTAKGSMPSPARTAAEPQPVLQVKRQQGHHHLRTTGVGEHAEQGADKARVAEQLQVDHRPLLHRLDPHKQPQQQGAPPTIRAYVSGLYPANPVGFDQTPDQAQQAGAEGQAAPRVEPRGLRVP
jgi:hypothetical protein